MHVAAYHIPNMVTRHGNLRQFSGQGKLLEFLGKKNKATKVLKTRKHCFYKFYFQVWKKTTMMQDEYCSEKQITLMTLPTYCKQNIAFVL